MYPRGVAESDHVLEHDRDLGDKASGGRPGERGDVSVFRRGQRGRDGAVRDPRSRFAQGLGGGDGGDVRIFS